MDNELSWDGESVGELLVRGDLIRLAHFKALRSAEVVEELPKGDPGKILKEKIRELYGR